MELVRKPERPTATDLFQQYIEHTLPMATALALMRASPALLAALSDAERDLTRLLSRLQDAIAKAAEAER